MHNGTLWCSNAGVSKVRPGGHLRTMKLSFEAPRITGTAAKGADGDFLCFSITILYLKLKILGAKQ